MTGEEVRKHLKMIKDGDLEEARKLAQRIERDSRMPLETLQRLWVAGGANAEKAQTVLNELGVLSVLAWLHASGAGGGPRTLDALGFAANACMEFSGQLVERATKWLDNKASVPIPEPERPVDEPEPPRRVCDEAYLLLRELLRSDESEMAGELNSHEFLDIEEEDRDVQIAHYKTAKRFNVLVEEPDAAGP